MKTLNEYETQVANLRNRLRNIEGGHDFLDLKEKLEAPLEEIRNHSEESYRSLAMKVEELLMEATIKVAEGHCNPWRGKIVIKSKSSPRKG